MPRVDFKLWDRVYILKLICTVQMTFSSFVTILYFYLIILQHWASVIDDRELVNMYKWSVIVISVIDFGLGTFLAIGANKSGNRCRQRILVWIILETFLIPTGVFLLIKMYNEIKFSRAHTSTDVHFKRISLVQTCYLLCHFLFIVYTIDFMASQKPKNKLYDPSIRPESVHEPTDPQITTTESRHIRMCQSFLFQPFSTKTNFQNVKSSDSEKLGTTSYT